MSGENRTRQLKPLPLEAYCFWYEDGEGSELWVTECDKDFSLLGDGTPSEQEIVFCPFCGKPIDECNPAIDMRSDGG